MRRIASLTGYTAAATLLLLAPGTAVATAAATAIPAAGAADHPAPTGIVGDSVGFGLDVATASVDLGQGITHGVIGR